jgi:hypothetical protein
VDCCLGTSPRAWFLMRAMVPKLAASCPALRDVYTRSWADAPFQDSRFYDSNEKNAGLNLCKEFPLLKKMGLIVSRRTEDGDWEGVGALQKLVRL